MNLTERARLDVLQITTNAGDFGTAILLTPPTVGSSAIAVTGLAKKHHLSVDTMGVAVNSKNASISISELELVAKQYPYRNGHGEVALVGHLATWTDSSGQPLTYVISEHFPDETLGLIVCILGDYQ
jgi:hypothetical protein